MNSGVADAARQLRAVTGADVDLRGLHPTQVPTVVGTLIDLQRMFPDVRVSSVSLYRRRLNHGLGFCDPGLVSEIHLNRFWFGRPIGALREASVRCAGRTVDGMPAWHGDMVDPAHPVVHEFGHCVHGARGRSDKFRHMLREGFRAASRDPRSAPTGYSVSNEAEWFAECFAAALCGGPATRVNPSVILVRRYLSDA